MLQYKIQVNNQNHVIIIYKLPLMQKTQDTACCQVCFVRTHKLLEHQRLIQCRKCKAVCHKSCYVPSNQKDDQFECDVCLATNSKIPQACIICGNNGLLKSIGFRFAHPSCLLFNDNVYVRSYKDLTFDSISDSFTSKEQKKRNHTRCYFCKKPSNLLKCFDQCENSTHIYCCLKNNNNDSQCWYFNTMVQGVNYSCYYNKKVQYLLNFVDQSLKSHLLPLTQDKIVRPKQFQLACKQHQSKIFQCCIDNKYFKYENFQSVQCDQCLKWYHNQCIAKGFKIKNDQNFFCPPCQKFQYLLRKNQNDSTLQLYLDRFPRLNFTDFIQLHYRFQKKNYKLTKRQHEFMVKMPIDPSYRYLLQKLDQNFIFSEFAFTKEFNTNEQKQKFNNLWRHKYNYILMFFMRKITLKQIKQHSQFRIQDQSNDENKTQHYIKILNSFNKQFNLQNKEINSIIQKILKWQSSIIKKQEEQFDSENKIQIEQEVKPKKISIKKINKTQSLKRQLSKRQLSKRQSPKRQSSKRQSSKRQSIKSYVLPSISSIKSQTIQDQSLQKSQSVERSSNTSKSSITSKSLSVKRSLSSSIKVKKIQIQKKSKRVTSSSQLPPLQINPTSKKNNSQLGYFSSMTQSNQSKQQNPSDPLNKIPFQCLKTPCQSNKIQQQQNFSQQAQKLSPIDVLKSKQYENQLYKFVLDMRKNKYDLEQFFDQIIHQNTKEQLRDMVILPFFQQNLNQQDFIRSCILERLIKSNIQIFQQFFDTTKPINPQYSKFNKKENLQIIFNGVSDYYYKSSNLVKRRYFRQMSLLKLQFQQNITKFIPKARAPIDIQLLLQIIRTKKLPKQFLLQVKEALPSISCKTSVNRLKYELYNRNHKNYYKSIPLTQQSILRVHKQFQQLCRCLLDIKKQEDQINQEDDKQKEFNLTHQILNVKTNLAKRFLDMVALVKQFQTYATKINKKHHHHQIQQQGLQHWVHPFRNIQIDKNNFHHVLNFVRTMMQNRFLVIMHARTNQQINKLGLKIMIWTSQNRHLWLQVVDNKQQNQLTFNKLERIYQLVHPQISENKQLSPSIIKQLNKIKKIFEVESKCINYFQSNKIISFQNPKHLYHALTIQIPQYTQFYKQMKIQFRLRKLELVRKWIKIYFQGLEAFGAKAILQQQYWDEFYPLYPFTRKQQRRLSYNQLCIIISTLQRSKFPQCSFKQKIKRLQQKYYIIQQKIQKYFKIQNDIFERYDLYKKQINKVKDKNRQVRFQMDQYDQQHRIQIHDIQDLLDKIKQNTNNKDQLLDFTTEGYEIEKNKCQFFMFLKKAEQIIEQKQKSMSVNQLNDLFLLIYKFPFYYKNMNTLHQCIKLKAQKLHLHQNRKNKIQCEQQQVMIRQQKVVMSKQWVELKSQYQILLKQLQSRQQVLKRQRVQQRVQILYKMCLCLIPSQQATLHNLQHQVHQKLQSLTNLIHHLEPFLTKRQQQNKMFTSLQIDNMIDLIIVYKAQGVLSHQFQALDEILNSYRRILKPVRNQEQEINKLLFKIQFLPPDFVTAQILNRKIQLQQALYKLQDSKEQFKNQDV